MCSCWVYRMNELGTLDLFPHETYSLEQQSPIFLAPGTSFVEDSFSTDGVWGAGSGGNGEQQIKLLLLALRLTSCCAAGS